MHLSKLEMLGFKSFMHKAELNFESGITAILGPNGCGKSNVVDALRWVLGEQSAKMLRGSKMENVIFDGTKKRPPMGIAEVSLTFTGASQTLAVDWDELTLKRRVTRAGGSEYFLNNQPYRLHEIRDLLAGTGLGNHAYAIIERNMVDEVVSEHGDKRRILFEEASGIMRYKIRRKESLSKLASTQADLTRLDDILDELGKSVRSLKYQVGRARSFQRLKEEMREAEGFGAAVKLHAAWQKSRELHRRLDGLGDETRADETQMKVIDEENARLQAELLEMESRYQSERGSLDVSTAEYRKAEEQLAVLDEKRRAEERRAEELLRDGRQAATNLDRLAAQREALESERIELDTQRESIAEALGRAEKEASEVRSRYGARRSRLENEKQLQLNFARTRAESGGELERLRERFEQSQTRGDELIAEQARLDEQAATLSSSLAKARDGEMESADALRAGEAALAETESGLAQCETELAAQVEEGRGLELRREKVGTRLEMLEHLQESGEGQARGTQWLLQEKADESGMRGVLSDCLRVAPEHRPAVEAALESVLGALVVEDGRSALAWLREAQSGDMGRTLLLALDLPAAERSAGAAPAGMLALSELVDCDEEFRRLVDGLLADHWLAPDAESALAAAASGGPARVFVTGDGFVLRSVGLLLAGDLSGGMLGRAEEIETLRVELAGLERDDRAVAERRIAAAEALRVLREERGERVGERDAARMAHGERGLERTRCETRLAALEDELTALEADRLYHKRQTDSLAGALESAEADWELASEGESSREEIDLAALEQEVAELERERELASATLAERKLEATTARGRQENLRLREENLEQSVVGEWTRRKDCESAEAESRKLIGELGLRSSDLREALIGRQGDLERKQQVVDECSTDIGRCREKLLEQQSTSRRLREVQREKEEARHGLEIERNTLLVKMEAIQEAARQSHGLDLDPARDPLVAEGYRPPEGTVIHEHIEDLRSKIDKLGTVNLLALEEFEEQNQRFEFLNTQREDLIKARDGLHETISKINREARQRFTETFKEIRENFIQIFTTLFEGGEADLQYVIDEDPLEADIVITAKPKEKNISSVQLLSTGEKTLTALSLLFAIYLTKPSPFCVFDEVDAPLDDANITRFLRLVREFSARTQFLLITHNKKTMEVARHLYGVTMEESGVSKIVSVAFDEVPDDMLADTAGAGSA